MSFESLGMTAGGGLRRAEICCRSCELVLDSSLSSNLLLGRKVSDLVDKLVEEEVGSIVFHGVYAGDKIGVRSNDV